MKRGAIEQTFIFIFALIVAALILGWGTKVILDLKGTAEQVQIGDSVEDLKQEIRTYFNLGIGSITPIKTIFPRDVGCVCFKNLFSYPGGGSASGNVPQLSAVNGLCNDASMEDRLRNDGKHNIFVGSDNRKHKVKDFKAIDELVPYDSGDKKTLCFQTKNRRITAQIRSGGDRVYIEKSI